MHRPSTYQIALSLFTLTTDMSEDATKEALYEIALDVCGMPRDNTVETGACDWANSKKGTPWPHWGVCRDKAIEELQEEDGFPERQAAIAVSFGEARYRDEQCMELMLTQQLEEIKKMLLQPK